MKKKILSFVLVLSMLCAFMPVIAVAETSGTCGDNVTWTLDQNGTLTISGAGDMENSAFYNNNNIKSVIIENGVTSLGDSDFMGCQELTSIIMPDSIIRIPDNIFYGCVKLVNVIIPNSVSEIGDCAFYYCSSLTNIIIPNNVTSIGYCAFCYCGKLTDITIGSKVKQVGNSAFGNCKKLSSVYITDLSAYLNINFDNNYSNPIYYANKLYLNKKRVVGEVTIPVGVKQIPIYAFAGLDSITSIIIPDCVTSIGYAAFNGCDRLANVTIGSGITRIEDNVFKDCNNLEIINYNASKVFPDLFSGCTVSSVFLGNYVASIEENAFNNCSNLNKIYIPKNVTEIEKGAFAGCANLTTVEYIGNQSDWNEIYIGTDNENLTNATINYNNALTPKPTPIPITKATITKTETDITYDFDVATENTYEECYVYVAVYDENGILCAINRVPLETTGNTSVSVDKNDNAKKAKVFVFSSTLQPIITSEEFPLI